MVNEMYRRLTPIVSIRYVRLQRKCRERCRGEPDTTIYGARIHQLLGLATVWSVIHRPVVFLELFLRPFARDKAGYVLALCRLPLVSTLVHD